ncbi:hypothetical protein KM043_012586 [Ampulex compressa]|nr:hypothetical protein KM043_012586 [Ampulex compressa]
MEEPSLSSRRLIAGTKGRPTKSIIVACTDLDSPRRMSSGIEAAGSPSKGPGAPFRERGDAPVGTTDATASLSNHPEPFVRWRIDGKILQHRAKRFEDNLKHGYPALSLYQRDKFTWS